MDRPENLLSAGQLILKICGETNKVWVSTFSYGIKLTKGEVKCQIMERLIKRSRPYILLQLCLHDAALYNSPSAHNRKTLKVCPI